MPTLPTLLAIAAAMIALGALAAGTFSLSRVREALDIGSPALFALLVAAMIGAQFNDVLMGWLSSADSAFLAPESTIFWAILAAATFMFAAYGRWLGGAIVRDPAI